MVQTTGGESPTQVDIENSKAALKNLKISDIERPQLQQNKDGPFHVKTISYEVEKE